MYDPFVAEFFFGGKTIVVEGDTEHSAFKEVVESNRSLFGEIHIVRARGKYTIIALCKILNQFGSPYAVLHDSDRKTIITKKGAVRANSAWPANEQILEIVAAAPNHSATLVASVPNFEEAMFGEPADGEKPYGAWEKVRKDADVRKKVTTF
ncbi:TOPRIM nucleotidyl transferase/hydrolase domain-containing protein [Pseudomonas sp. SLFW]|uniref:TOPRIM nucleotidyl transferase/hydrolase domain-containing protein n=1 Tax=Pseudomonas sp. SLFW TaxID=2683259 RepID=UPI001C497CA4|nr:TOPRIM nucleotidyl transferase/hydrolase domain-containing protein [Pseudomonas sp. SLFW]